MDKKVLIGVLCLSMTGNIILTGLNFLPRTTEIPMNYTCDTNINITEIPMNYTCLLDTNRYLIGNKIYGHICYNKWLDLSIVDLRYYKDGYVNLTGVNFKID